MTETVDFRKVRAENRRRARQVLHDFLEGAASGDCKRVADTLDMLEDGDFDGGGWARALKGAAKLPSVSPETREFFLRVYIQSGDHIRQETSSHAALLTGLRVLLPTYTGPAMRLYRGEGAWNRRRRVYGVSWTASRDVADNFAQRMIWRSSRGGSVLLETLAPAEAIICRVPEDEDRYREEEYIVDRRKLMKVTVLARYPFKAPN